MVMTMRTIVPAEGAILERILETTYPSRHDGLSRHAFARCDTALRRTPWALHHEQRFALVEGTNVLASAQRQDLTATLDGRDVRVCGISGVFVEPARDGDRHEEELVERLFEDARADYEIALFWTPAHHRCRAPKGFEPIPTEDVELRVAESPRHGAPMTLVRGGEDRDLAAIVAMGHVRASQFRFHLNRDVDLVKYAITKKRLLAGLGTPGVRQLQFVIAEEGISAAAYVVISIAGGIWTIEECGDRDSSAARVGAILQALIAREPAELRPVIRGWLPPGLVPPQATILSAQPSGEVVMMKVLSATIEQPRLSAADVLYWRSDIF